MLEDPKHGSWSFRMSAGFDPITKKRRQINGGAFATKKEAQQERNRVAVRLDQGKVPSINRTTFAEYLPKWLERRTTLHTKSKKPLSPTTVETYRRYIVNDIAPSRLGAMQLREIRRRHVQAFVDELAEKRGAVTVARIVAVIQGALSQAVTEEYIDETPAHHLELPPVASKEVAVWEPEQVGHFLDVAGEHRLGAVFELAIFTGMRRKEIVELDWVDVDLVRRGVRVRRSSTKSDAGERRVALDDRAVGALVAWQIAQAAEREAWGEAYVESGRVFTMEDGRPLKLQYLTRLFERLRKKADLPKMTFHGQRHQQASLQIAAGTDIAVVSKRLGHASVSITADLYTHMLQAKDHAAASAASGLVPPRRVGARTLHAHGAENEIEAAPPAGGNGL